MTPTEQGVRSAVDNMSSMDRVNAIMELRRRRVAGEILTEDEVTYAIRLLRAERTTAAKKRSKTAPDPGPKLTLDDF
tara:strand:- start:222 stop:452 length:231 start_codon:yes stop_codon:yes gene_type:complete